jgi:hypothetical protein
MAAAGHRFDRHRIQDREAIGIGRGATNPTAPFMLQRIIQGSSPATALSGHHECPLAHKADSEKVPGSRPYTAMVRAPSTVSTTPVSPRNFSPGYVPFGSRASRVMRLQPSASTVALAPVPAVRQAPGRSAAPPSGVGSTGGVGRWRRSRFDSGNGRLRRPSGSALSEVLRVDGGSPVHAMGGR